METSNEACCEPVQHMTSSVEFNGDKRPHISLNVASVERSLPFYRALFNQPPVKLKVDYAKFEPREPPVNFTLNEHPDLVDNNGHFGIEVKTTAEVEDYLARFKKLEVNIDTKETEVACCFSVQNKVWVVDPDGNHWEIFVVVEDEAEDGCGPTCLCYDPASGECKWN